MKRIGLAVFSLILWGTRAHSAADCNRLESADADQIIEALGDKQYLLIGEIHGTKEIPALVEEILCKLSSEGKTLVYTWELPANFEEDYVKFTTPHIDFSVEQLLSHSMWHDRNDGTTSYAQLKLAQYIKGLNEDGSHILYVGSAMPVYPDVFNRDFFPQYNIMMAHNMMRWGESLPVDHVILLAGSAHTRLTAFPGPDGSEKRTVGQVLPRNDVLSVQIRAAGGASYSLGKNEQGEFASKVYPFDGEPYHNMPRNTLIELEDDENYHARIVLDAFTASLPAIEYFPHLVRENESRKNSEDVHPPLFHGGPTY